MILIVGGVVWLRWHAMERARKHQLELARIQSGQREIVREREVITREVLIKCGSCGARYPQGTTKCLTCGANL